VANPPAAKRRRPTHGGAAREEATVVRLKRWRHQTQARGAARLGEGPGDQGGHRSDAGDDLPRRPWHGLGVDLAAEHHLSHRWARSKQQFTAEVMDKTARMIA
jgi:hypothetical protein